jgi:hypothetical protein
LGDWGDLFEKLTFLWRVHKRVLNICFILFFIKNKYTNVFRFDNKVLSLHQTLNFIDMQVISTREFRANQKKYFDLAANETIYVARRNEAPILISVAKDEDMLNKEELLSIQKGLDDVRNGRVNRMEKWESLDDFLDRMGHV